MRIRRVVLVAYSVSALMVGTFLSASSALAAAEGNHWVVDNHHGHSVWAYDVDGPRDYNHGYTTHSIADYMVAQIHYKFGQGLLCTDDGNSTHKHCWATVTWQSIESWHRGPHISNHYMA